MCLRLSSVSHLLRLVIGILALTHCYGVVLVTNKTPPRVSAAVGSPTVLQCDGTTSSGGRAPTFSWRKDNVPLGSSFRGTITTSAGSTSSQATSVLSIPNVSAAHRGWYTCFAQDSSSDGSKDFYIDVQEPINILSTQVNVLRVVTGSAILLPCIATGLPRPAITWEKDGVRLPMTGSGYKIDSALGWLSISNATQGDAANYTCQASSTIGVSSGDSYTFEVLVDQEQPDVSQPTINSARVQELKVGMSTVFNVSINVVSSPTFYSWEKNGVTVAENNVSRSLGTILTLTFSLQVTSQADAGIYTATVFGNKTAVMGAIDVVSDPVVTAVTRSKLYVLAAPVTRVAYIGCLVTGRPAPTLVLTGTGISVPTSPTGSISTDLQITYSGAPVTYTCSAAGAASATVTLTRINSCSSMATHNHIVNPTGASAPSNGWNSSQPVGNMVDPMTGNYFFTVTARPQEKSGEMSAYMQLGIGVAMSAIGFRMRVRNSTAAPGSQAVAILQYLQRGTAEQPVNEVGFTSQTTFTTNSSEWMWVLHNDTIPRTSLTRAARITLRSQLANGSTMASVAEFDSFCFLFFGTRTAAPVFIAVLPSAATVYIGYMLTLDCLAESKPSPTYMWTHNRSPIPGATSSKYTFSPPTKVLAGTYACTATSSGVGTIAQSTTVSVLDVVEPTVIDAMGNNETESVSSKAVNLTCPVDGAPLFFTWLKGATEVPIEKGRVEWSNTSNTLQILSAKSSDAGSYQCQGRNTRGTARATVTLEVFFPPELESTGMLQNPRRLDRNARETLVCPLSGKPDPSITWTVNSRDVAGLQSEDAVANDEMKSLAFRFTSTFPDPTNITCRGTNVYGTFGPVQWLLGTKVVVITTAPTGPTTTTVNIPWWEELGPFKALKRWIWICILAGVLILLILLIACCCHYCRKRKRRTLTPSRDVLRQNSTRPSDTVRTNASYHKGGGEAFVAINTGAAPEPPMHSHPAAPYSDLGHAGSVAPPPSYNHATSYPSPGGAPPPLPNMDNHPVNRRSQSVSMVQEAPEAAALEYLDPEDNISNRPPAPIPGADDVTPLVAQPQDYINVDARPPAPLPGGGPLDYENMS